MDSQGDEDFSYGDMEVTTQSDYDKEQAIPLPQLGAPALPTHDSDEPERITEAGWQTSLSYFERGSVMVSSSSPRSVNTLKDEFDERKQRFRDLLAKDNTKFNLIVAAQNGRVLPDPLKTALKKVTTREGESDFQIISLIRLLFLGDESVAEIATAKRQSVSALDTFPFWPTGSKNQANMDKLVFWSENHLIMTLGSCYLFRQYKLNPELNVAPETKKIILQQLDKTLETKLLKIYLRAHCLDIFNGVYEVNSSVYLPYTLSGLLNLYDFALDTEVKELAHKIIDRVVHHVMLCTTSNGTSNLVAGGRTFIRTRLRTHGHNINQLTNLITGLSPDPWNATAITDYILTTSWIPNFAQVKEALEFEGTHPVLALSHPTAVTRDIYTRLADAEGVNHRELVPLYWSAGLVTHPDYVQDTREYMQDKNMVKNENLSALAYFSPGYLARTMAHYSTISAGQVYTGISLNVYKKPKQNLALTSFAGFNPHVAAFQQQPWIANVSGMGVWSQAGSGSEGIMKFGMTNTHNPAITQKGSVLIASYCTPDSLIYRFFMGNVFSSSVRLFWPLQFLTNTCCFRAPTATTYTSVTSPTATNPMVMHSTVAMLDQTVQKAAVWIAGQRGECYVAVYCSQKTHMDHSAVKDAEVKETNTSKGVYVPRRICREYRHSWVVVVGTTRDYPTLQTFVDARCLKMDIQETLGGSARVGARAQYVFKVVDTVEGQLANTVSLPT